MSWLRKFPHAEWWLGGLMFLLCATLTVLQYHWTGEIARAEMTRRRGNLAEQAQALAREFDAELSASCDQLTPDRAEFANQTREATHLARFKNWLATKPRPIFRRIALGQEVNQQVQLSVLDQTAARFIPTNWPSEWATMEAAITGKAQGGAPPGTDRRGVLLEFPVFGGTDRGGPGPGGEHWLILEIDLAYARDRWLPELIAKHLNPSGAAVNDAGIQIGDTTTLYATATAPARSGTETISLRFNRLGKSGQRSQMPGQTSGAWLLEAWQRPDALDATVAASRRRNLAVAGGINLIMFATGIALIHHTRRSRKLAEQQMSFVANVSHELRTPLTVIRGAAHNLKRGVVHERPQIEQYSGLIIEHTEQLTDMLEQLLELAGAKKNRAALAHKPVELGKVLSEAIAAAKHDTQIAGCAVQFELPAALPRVTGDALALRRVFQNLITNAAKHGGDGGWIGVTAKGINRHEAPHVEVRVSDRGAGIPAAEQADIFKPFVRGARAEAKQIRGSGLGLSLVQEIVALHQGSVSLDSQPGHGATFIVRLPTAKEQT